MAAELAYLALTSLSGGLVLWAVAERLLYAATGHQHLTSRASASAPAVPLWAAVPLAAACAVAARNHSHLRQMRLRGCKPAAMYPHRDRLLGTDWVVDMMRAARANKILQTWDGLFKNVANTFWVHNVGSWIVTTNEPDNVKALLATDFDAWVIGSVRQSFALLALGRHAIFSVNGPEWHTARAMIRPSFVRNQIADLECTDRHLENFLARVPRDGGDVDLQDLLFRFMMDISTDFMFGTSTNTLVDPTAEALDFADCFDYALATATMRGRLGWIAFWFPDKKLTESVARCKAFIDRYVREAVADGKSSKERPYVFMNEIIRAGAPHDYVRDQLLAMILGGRDTSASTLSSLFWVLARRPDVVRKLRREVVETLGQKKPTWTDLKDMKYLNMVLKETLRLWAPVSSNLRMAAHDTVLPKGGGPDGQSPLFVPKGSSCRFSLYSLHRRKDLYGEDAEEFRPERWETLRVSWEYVPFSGGPRVCIGQQFALTQMSYLVARVFQTFQSIEASDNKPMDFHVSSTISLVNGCWARLTPA
jgi:cytochrome P450